MTQTNKPYEVAVYYFPNYHVDARNRALRAARAPTNGSW